MYNRRVTYALLRQTMVLSIMGQTVLVLGHGTGAFLSVVRSLGRRGLQVHVGWWTPDAPELYSRYIHKRENIPAYDTENDFWLEALCHIMQKEQFSLVIPTNEQSIRPLQLHRERLQSIGRIYLLSQNAFSIAFDKLATHRLASELQIPIPRQYVLTSESDVGIPLENLDFPIVVKPESSYAVTYMHARRNVTKTYDRASYVAAVQHNLQCASRVLVQENFIGHGVGVEVLANEGKILFIFQHVRVHEVVRGGASSWRKSVPVHSELRAASEKLIEALAYTGVAMIEFKYNSATGRWVLLEINARFWGSLALALAATADFPYFLYQMLTKNKRDFSPEYQSNIYCRNFKSDLKWTFENFTHNRADPTLSVRPIPLAIFDWWRAFTFMEANDTFAHDDLRPGFAEAALSIRTIFQRRFLSVHKKIAGFAFLRRRGHLSAMRALSKASIILWVCKGNICRSPFAHLLAARLMSPEIQHLSAGYYPIEGRASPHDAIAAARSFNIDLGVHRSRVLHANDVESADLIVAFDTEIFGYVAQHFPNAGKKLVRMTDFVEAGDTEVADPFNQGKAAFDHCYATIASILERVARR